MEHHAPDRRRRTLRHVRARHLRLGADDRDTTRVGSAGATPDDGVPDEAVGETIIVTRTRAANRTAADGSVPIVVISAETLQMSATGKINKILNQLIPSFNFPQPSINNGTDVIRPATLRGLNLDQTPIQINVKRRHTSALLNINWSVGRGATATCG